LKDLVAFLSELHALGIGLFLHQQGLDTTTPAGKAMLLPFDAQPLRRGKLHVRQETPRGPPEIQLSPLQQRDATTHEIEAIVTRMADAKSRT
jgi:DNA invertase Pin-like site-specific DNA recombinase